VSEKDCKLAHMPAARDEEHEEHERVSERVSEGVAGQDPRAALCAELAADHVNMLRLRSLCRAHPGE
jgi:transposase